MIHNLGSPTRSFTTEWDVNYWSIVAQLKSNKSGNCDLSSVLSANHFIIVADLCIMPDQLTDFKGPASIPFTISH